MGEQERESLKIQKLMDRVQTAAMVSGLANVKPDGVYFGRKGLISEQKARDTDLLAEQSVLT